MRTFFTLFSSVICRVSPLGSGVAAFVFLSVWLLTSAIAKPQPQQPITGTSSWQICVLPSAATQHNYGSHDRGILSPGFTDRNLLSQSLSFPSLSFSSFSFFNSLFLSFFFSSTYHFICHDSMGRRKESKGLYPLFLLVRRHSFCWAS